MCYFLYHDFGVYEITLPEGIKMDKIKFNSLLLI